MKNANHYVFWFSPLFIFIIFFFHSITEGVVSTSEKDGECSRAEPGVCSHT